MGLEVADNHVNALLLQDLGLFQHPIGFSGAGCITQKNLEASLTTHAPDLLGKYANVYSLGEIDQAIDRIASQLLPPSPTLAVTDKDLSDAVLPSEFDESFHRVMSLENMNGCVQIPGDLEIPVQSILVLGRQIGLPHVRHKQVSMKAIRVAPTALQDLPGSDLGVMPTRMRSWIPQFSSIW